MDLNPIARVRVAKPNVGEGLQTLAQYQRRGLMVLNHLGSSLRDKSRSFPKAEGFNPQGCIYFLDDH